MRERYLNDLLNYLTQAGVWLKKGECLHSLGRLDEAAFAYAQVVNLAPNHLDARLILASLHQQLGRPNQALDILSGEKSNIFYYVSDKWNHPEKRDVFFWKEIVSWLEMWKWWLYRFKKKLKNNIGLTWIRNQIFAMTGRNAESRGTYMYQATQLWVFVNITYGGKWRHIFELKTKKMTVTIKGRLFRFANSLLQHTTQKTVCLVWCACRREIKSVLFGKNVWGVNLL